MKLQSLAEFRQAPDFRGRSAAVVVLWWLVRDTLFLCSPQPLYAWRRFLLKIFGAKIGANVQFRPTVRITYPWKLEVGDNSWIGDFTELYTLGPIIIGNNVCVSQNCYLCTGTHDESVRSFDISAEPISLADECWIAADCFIAPGVKIGFGAVVSARSSVFHDVAELEVVRGNPAKFARRRRLGGGNLGSDGTHPQAN